MKGDKFQLVDVASEGSPPPAARNQDETATGDAPDDDQRQPEQEASEDYQRPIVDSVGEDGAITSRRAA